MEERACGPPRLPALERVAIASGNRGDSVDKRLRDQQPEHLPEVLPRNR